jgi:serine/threonine-protein kinase RsbW
MGVDEKVSASLKLAVEEACANVIQHGFKDTEPGDIRMSVEHLGDRVQVQIADSGAAFGEHFDAPPDRTAAVQDSELGGLGVFFVKAMVDELSYESSDGVNRLTLIKRL